MAAAIFFAFLIYLRWDGGRGGRAGRSTACAGWSAPSHYGVPVALLATGAILVLRPMLPAVRPFRAGGLCLFAALALGLAAGTLGLGPGGAAVRWDPEWVRPRGGVVGEALYWGARRRSARSARTSSPCSCSWPRCCC